jgi:putative membrane protein
MRFILRVLATALALWLTHLIFSSHFLVLPAGASALQELLAFVIAGLIFVLVHDIIKPVIKVLTGCLYVMTFGLFGLVVSALLLWIVTWLSGVIDFGVDVHGGFWWYVGIALVIALIGAVIEWFVPKKARK